VNAIATLGTGRCVTACDEGFFRLWDVETRQMLAECKMPQRTPGQEFPLDNLYSVAVSPEGAYVIGGTEVGKLVRWDLPRNPNPQAADMGVELLHKSGTIRGIVFLDEQHVVTSDQHGHVRVLEIGAKAAVEKASVDLGVDAMSVVVAPASPASTTRAVYVGTGSDTTPGRIYTLRLEAR
jgi:hypothetical protein